VYGNDWEVVRVTGESASLESGITQLAERGPGTRAIYVWNFPLEITFKSTNPYGWPKLCVTAMEGVSPKVTIKGYGWCHIPLNPGRYENTIRLFKPRNSSIIQGIISGITGKTPEFINPTSICEGEGREGKIFKKF
jgi:B9 domain-containing protein 1